MLLISGDEDDELALGQYELSDGQKSDNDDDEIGVLSFSDHHCETLISKLQTCNVLSKHNSLDQLLSHFYPPAK